MAMGAIFVCWLASRLVERRDRGFVVSIVVVSFALRAFWSVFQHIINPAVWPIFAADAILRYNWSKNRAEAWEQGLYAPSLPMGLGDAHAELIMLKTIALFRVFGVSPMLPEAVTITVNVTVIIAIYLICRQIGAVRNAARAAAVFGAFLPSLMFWSTQNVKDPVTAAGVTWAALAVISISQRARSGDFALLSGATFLTVVYRPYVGFMLIMGQLLGGLMTVKLPRTALGSVSRISMLVVMVPLILYAGLREMEQTYGGVDLHWAIEQYTEFHEAASQRPGARGSEYEIPLTADTPTQAIMQLPIRILLLLLTPIPLFPGGLTKLMMYPEMWFIYLFLVPRFGTGVCEAWRKNRPALILLLMVIAPMISGYALKTSVSGEAFRMRVQFLPVLLVFAGVGHAVRQQRKLERKQRRAEKMRYRRQPEKVSASVRDQAGT